MASDHAGQGKIQRASRELRLELNRRIFNGQLGPQIIPWLNAEPEMQKICQDFFAGEPVNDMNLSRYRGGAYQKWLDRQEELEDGQELAEFSLELAKATDGNLSEGAAQLLAGHYIRALRKPPTGEDGQPSLPNTDTAIAVAALRGMDEKKKERRLKERALAQKDIAIEQKNRELAQKDRDLDRKELDQMMQHSGYILEAVETKWEALQAVAASGADAETRQKDVARIVFGDRLLQLMEQRRKEALEA